MRLPVLQTSCILRTEHMARDHSFFDLFSDFQRMHEINHENFLKILKDNQNTLFGKQYGFKNIRTESDYQRAVPFTEYRDYESFLGKENGHTSYPIKTVLTTSGTTSGRQKEFPLTYESLERYADYVFQMPYHLMGAKQGPHLHVSVFRPEINGKTLISAAYYNHIFETGILDINAFYGGEKLMYSDSVRDVAYVKAYLALSCKDLVSLQAIFLYDLLSLMVYIEQNWKRLLSDMRRGAISGDLDDETKSALLKYKPCPERIEELEKELSRGFDRNTVANLWKKMKFVIGIGGGIYRFQEAELKRYLGDIPVYYTIFASSECMMGIAVQMNKAEYALFPRNAYYEFLKEDGTLIPIEKVEKDGVYELVLTTFSGLYRYKTNDRIRVVSFMGESPVFVAVGRINNVLNIAGEKLDEAVAKETVIRFIDELQIHVSDFALGVDTSVIPNRYCLFMESDVLPSDDWAELLDRKLKEANPDYADVRDLQLVLKPRVCTLEKGMIRDTFIKKTKGQSHNKPKTFLDRSLTATLLQEGEGNE